MRKLVPITPHDFLLGYGNGYNIVHSNLQGSILYTVVIAYKNIVGSREKCSYNRYVLITDILYMIYNRYICSYNRCSYNRYSSNTKL